MEPCGVSAVTLTGSVRPLQTALGVEVTYHAIASWSPCSTSRLFRGSTNVARLMSVNRAFPAVIWPVPSKNLCTTMIPFHRNGLCARSSASDMAGGTTTNGNRLALVSLYSLSITSASAGAGQIEATACLEAGLSCSPLTDVPGVTGPADGCESDGNRWPNEKHPLELVVGLDADVAFDELSCEAS